MATGRGKKRGRRSLGEKKEEREEKGLLQKKEIAIKRTAIFQNRQTLKEKLLVNKNSNILGTYHVPLL